MSRSVNVARAIACRGPGGRRRWRRRRRAGPPRWSAARSRSARRWPGRSGGRTRHPEARSAGRWSRHTRRCPGWAATGQPDDAGALGAGGDPELEPVGSCSKRAIEAASASNRVAAASTTDWSSAVSASLEMARAMAARRATAARRSRTASAEGSVPGDVGGSVMGRGQCTGRVPRRWCRLDDNARVRSRVDAARPSCDRCHSIAVRGADAHQGEPPMAAKPKAADQPDPKDIEGSDDVEGHSMLVDHVVGPEPGGSPLQGDRAAGQGPAAGSRRSQPDAQAPLVPPTISGARDPTPGASPIPVSTAGPDGPAVAVCLGGAGLRHGTATGALAARASPLRLRPRGS